MSTGKPLITFCFAASLALNVAFAIWFSTRGGAVPPLEPTSRAVALAQATKPALTPDTWPGLRDDNLSTLVARLREAGFPPSIIRAILRHEIGEAFATRRRALESSGQSRPFWQSQEIDLATRLALRELEREQATRFRTILGEEADEDLPLMNLDRGWHFSYLPAEKTALLFPLLRDYDRRRREISSAGALLGADREKMAVLERDTRVTLARVLTPTELLEYDLRSSDTAALLRSTLAAFNPTEQEFRALFQVQRGFDEQWNQRWGPSNLPPEQERARQAAYPQLWEQYKAVLGPERYARYERSSDGNYQRTTLLVARLQLPTETTEQLWATREEFQRQSDAVNRDRTLSTEQRHAQLQALSQSATARVAPLVGGDRNLDLYRHHGGSWLLNLAPRP